MAQSENRLREWSVQWEDSSKPNEFVKLSSKLARGISPKQRVRMGRTEVSCDLFVCRLTGQKGTSFSIPAKLRRPTSLPKASNGMMDGAVNARAEQTSPVPMQLCYSSETTVSDR